MYRAGLKFLDVDPKPATSINLAYPPPVNKPRRRGPIKVKVTVEVLEHAALSASTGRVDRWQHWSESIGSR